MQKTKSTLVLVAIVMTCCGSSFAQQAISAEKKDLILQFRKLTGADNVSGSINFSSDGVREILVAVVEQDKELTDTQKGEVLQFVTEATARVDKAARDFIADKSQIAELSEEVIFKIYDKEFTEDELKEIIAFYRSPTGQKSAVFLRTLSSQVQAKFGEVIQLKLSSIIQPKIQMETEQLKQKIKDVKVNKGAN